MSYCAKSDLVARYGAQELAQLTDEVAAHVPDDTEITAACDEASSLIDGYVAGRYVVPLSPVPPMVKSWACAIARRLLWKDRALPDSAVAVAYEDALTALREVAKGVLRLPASSGEASAASGGSVNVISADQVFTDELLVLMP